MRGLPFRWGVLLAVLWSVQAPALIAQDTPAAVPPFDYADAWAQVDSLERQGLPQSARAVVDSIYTAAQAESAEAQFIKALLHQSKYKIELEEDAPNRVVADVRRQLPDVSPEAQAVLHSILGELFVRYYQANQYRFYNRTEAAVYDEDDLETWDLKKLLTEATDHYLRSVAPAETLQAVPVEVYEALLVATPVTRPLRPTLYDFLAHRAIEFLIGGEAGLITPERALILQDDAYFGPALAFIDLALPAQDRPAPGYEALRLLQNLLALHLRRDDPAALVEADLQRLALVHAHAVTPAKDSLYVQRLEALRAQYAGSPLFAEVTFALAQEYARRGDRYRPGGYSDAATEADRLARRTAHALCLPAVERFPDTRGGINCRALRASIEQKHLAFEAAGIGVPDAPMLARVAYRNVERVYVKAVRVTWDEQRRFEEVRYHTERRTAWLRTFAGRPGVAAAPVALPDDGDFQEHAVEIEAPTLGAGLYVLLAGTDPGFSIEGDALAYTFVQVSSLSYVSRRTAEGTYDVYVQDRATGHPLPDARIRLQYDDAALGAITLRTDRDGYALLAPRENESFSLILYHRGDTLFPTERFYSYRRDRRDARRRATHFFTDRAIYRPGQTIYFKGIAMEVEDGRYTLDPGARSRVRLLDVNGQEVAALDLVANAYGAFSGSFTAPQGVLTGQMTIRDDHGVASFSVEEYKRPRFEVRLDPVEGTPLVGDTVTVTGAAASYAGASLDGAQVAYRVTRTPRWRSWRYGGRPPQMQTVEISRGVVETDADGAFTLSFPALPDLSVARDTDPSFDFRVEIDVTDITGETHSAQTTVVVGYTALALNLGVPALLDKSGAASARITSANLNGTPAPAQGRLVVTRLRAPDRLLRPRLWQAPDRFVLQPDAFHAAFPHDEYDREADRSTWAVQDTVLTASFDTAKQQDYALTGLAGWPSGAYRFELHAEDPTGRPLRVRQDVTVFAPAERRLPVPTLDWFVPLKTSGEPGEAAAFLIGSGAQDTRVLFEIEHDGAITERRWLRLSDEQQRVEAPIAEKHRGNFSVHVTFVRHNRAFGRTQTVTVPHTNRRLRLSLATFRDKMYPGSEEVWKIKIDGPGQEAVAAEMVAAMYDVSLDAFRPHGWSFNVLPYDYARLRWQVGNLRQVARSTLEARRWNPSQAFYPSGYDRLNWFGFDFFGDRRVAMRAMDLAAPAPEAAMEEAEAARDEDAPAKQEAAPAPEEPDSDPLAQVQARRNLNETAFFFPHLETNAEGEVVFAFTMPEALTRWKMLALAHTKDLKFGQLLHEVVTQKELMVTPNAPRFFREADTLVFAAKVANLSDTLLTGRARLMLFDALTMTPLDAALGNTDADRAFTVAPGGSQAFGWTLTIPDGVQAVTYRVVAEAGAFSDGEEAVVPVLTNRMLVTESLPLPVRGDETRTFRFDKLLDTTSPTLRHHRLTLEYTPNPVWYAVQALPYMMEFPHECAEQVFSRYYANSIAAHIVAQNPRIERVYEAWRQAEAGALVSNLEKNQELKALLLEATPWVLQAHDETERKKRIALLFDANRMRDERDRALRKLQQMQGGDGAWPWFSGMQPDRYITQHVVAGMGHLRRLGVLSAQDEDRMAGMLAEAVGFLDARIRADYDWLIEHEKDLERQHIGPVQFQYLYARSFFPDVAWADDHREAFDYYLGQARRYWLSQNQYVQALAALALHRYDDAATPRQILRSLKEYALVSDELGMYWKHDAGYYWHQAPIETQALLIEAFHEIAGDEASVEAMKQWLLKQKQTQDWRTTKATAEAVYALLLRGTDLTAEDARVEIRLGDHVIDAGARADAEAGTGYFKTAWDAPAITPEMGRITVRKEGRGIGWGAAYWQYFEQLDRITTHETPLRLEKGVFLQQQTDTGPLLVPVDSATALAPGDLLTVRIVLHADRDFEYAHLKDMRASGLEPVNVLSRYRYQDGLGYYESTRDAATHFFISYLPKGTYVFEYPLRVNHAGSFSNGITTIQCMYAPEFTAHSEGIRLHIGADRE